MTAEDTYLHAVERMLHGIAPEHRATVLDDLRGHFADAEEAGRPIEETIRALGAPQEIADRAREEFEQRTPGRRSPGRSSPGACCRVRPWCWRS
ncbi:hypothetical protein GCM10025863_26720 [Microbacterium suwonense]|uniref:DUF892 family protein n=2 Tax=Microbacterium suwonense TaxID=683047 RepID=A0ABM8FWJ4_9MICO|nr:hypothetical protein GCM10025863_26720 [Microbacterium suwonense]